jgi:hypothetical protein
MYALGNIGWAGAKSLHDHESRAGGYRDVR